MILGSTKLTNITLHDGKNYSMQISCREFPGVKFWVHIDNIDPSDLENHLLHAGTPAQNWVTGKPHWLRVLNKVLVPLDPTREWPEGKLTPPSHLVKLASFAGINGEGNDSTVNKRGQEY